MSSLQIYVMRREDGPGWMVRWVVLEGGWGLLEILLGSSWVEDDREVKD